MAIDAAVLEALVKAGATAEMIVAAVTADQANDEARREARRANNAERQRRFKARRRDENEASGNADNALPRVNNAGPLSLPPNEKISNPPTHTPENKPARVKAGSGKPAGKPDGVSDQTWGDFQILRKRKGAPLTETALAGIEAEARKAGWPIEAALAKCVTRGWQGFEAEWVAGQPMAANSDNPLLSRVKSRQLATGP